MNHKSNQLSQVLKTIVEIDPPEKLKGVILSRIEQKMNRLLRLELFISRLGLAGSFFFLFYTTFAFGRTILESEFWKIASLVVSDLGVVTQNWQEFSYSLLETIPVTNLVAIILPTFAFLAFIYFYASLNSKKRQHRYV